MAQEAGRSPDSAADAVLSFADRVLEEHSHSSRLQSVATRENSGRRIQRYGLEGPEGLFFAFGFEKTSCFRVHVLALAFSSRRQVKYEPAAATTTTAVVRLYNFRSFRRKNC